MPDHTGNLGQVGETTNLWIVGNHRTKNVYSGTSNIGPGPKPEGMDQNRASKNPVYAMGANSDVAHPYAAPHDTTQ
jgi:hypothetical protein